MSYTGVKKDVDDLVKKYVDDKIKQCCRQIKPLTPVTRIIIDNGYRKMEFYPDITGKKKIESVYSTYSGRTNTFGTHLIL